MKKFIKVENRQLPSEDHPFYMLTYEEDGKIKDMCSNSIDNVSDFIKKNFINPQGEWSWSGSNGNGKNYYNCSVCGRLIEATRAELIKFPYCHCGAQMEVKKEKLAYEK